MSSIIDISMPWWAWIIAAGVAILVIIDLIRLRVLLKEGNLHSKSLEEALSRANNDRDSKEQQRNEACQWMSQAQGHVRNHVANPHGQGFALWILSLLWYNGAEDKELRPAVLQYAVVEGNLFNNATSSSAVEAIASSARDSLKTTAASWLNRYGEEISRYKSELQSKLDEAGNGDVLLDEGAPEEVLDLRHEDI